MCLIVNIIINISNHILLPTGRGSLIFKSIGLMKSKTIMIYQELQNDCNPLGEHTHRDT